VTTTGTPTDLQLVLVRSIFDSAAAATRAGDDVSLMTAMLLYDLAIEQAAHLILGPPQKGNDRTLNDLLNAVEAKLPSLKGVAPLAEARKLRKARNTVMHAAAVPSASNVAMWQGVAERALDDLVRAAFGRDFRSISIVGFIRSPDIREHLAEATALAASGHLRKALVLAGATFQVLWSRWGAISMKQYPDVPQRLFKLALAVFGYETDIVMPGPGGKGREQAVDSMGFDSVEVAKIMRLLGLAERLLHAEEDEARKLMQEAEASPADLDFFVDRVARVTWRLETHHPKMVRARDEEEATS
jgi:hypothetical protein